MGNAILDLALQALKEAGFPAAGAFPGQQAPHITQTVATGHIFQVDGANQTITLEISILCPGHMGGTACELAARKAAAALQSTKAICTQKGCVYDPVTQVYAVSILAVYSGVCTENSHTLGPGFQIHLNGVQRPWATEFQEEKVQQQTLEFATRSAQAVAITAGSYYWNLQLTELVPPGFAETPEPEGEFQLKILREGRTELYSPCRWSSVTRSFGPKGVQRVCKGIALGRKEVLA